MDSRSNNRTGIPDLNAAISKQMNLGGNRDVMQVGTMDESFYGQMYSGSVVNSNYMMGYDHQSIATTNYDPEAD